MSNTKNGRVRMKLELTPKLDQRLRVIAAELDTTKEDVMRRAFVMMAKCHDAIRQGKYAGIAADTDSLETQFVGI